MVERCLVLVMPVLIIRCAAYPIILGLWFVGHEDEQVLRRGGHRRSFRLLVDRTAIAGQRVGIVYA